MGNHPAAYFGNHYLVRGCDRGCMLPLASSIKYAWKKQVHDGKQKFCLDKGDTSHRTRNIKIAW
jgi:hypothetical protein